MTNPCRETLLSLALLTALTLGAPAARAGLHLAVSGRATVDTRSAFSVRAVTSPYSSGTRRAVFLHGVPFDVTFTVAVEWNGRTPGQIRFVTPRGTYTQAAANPSRTFDMGTGFGPGGRLKVVAVDSTGVSTAEFDANIVVAPPPPGLSAGMLRVLPGASSFRYKLAAWTTLTIGGSKADSLAPHVPSDIPFFGGTGYGFKRMSPSYSAEINPNGTASYRILQPGEADSWALLTGSPARIKDAVAVGGFDLEPSLGGQINWRYDADTKSWGLNTGQILAGLDATLSLGPAYVWSPPPIYLIGEVSAGVEAALGVTGIASGDLELAGDLDLSVGGTARAGAGIANLLAIEGYLGITGGVELGFPADPALQDAYVTLSGGVQVVALFFRWPEDPWLEYTWRRSDGRALDLGIQFPDFRAGPGTPVSREYVSLRGAGPLRGTSRTAVAGGIEEVLATNVFPYAQPALAMHGERLVLLWVGDDGSRSDMNRTQLFSRVWTAADGWSTDATVEDDGTADFAPALATTADGAVAAWENFGAVLPDDADFETTLATEEISVAEYDADSGTWSAALRLTTNGVVDHAPCVAAAGSATLAVWLRNGDNDLVGTPATPNAIMFSERPAGGDWSVPATAAAGLSGVATTALGFDGTRGVYVFSVDADGDLGTDTDQELYRLESTAGTGWSAPVRLTDDDVSDTNPQLLPDGGGGPRLFWYRGGTIMMARADDLSDQAVVVATDGTSGGRDFRACASPSGQIALVYASAAPQGQDLYVAVYDADHGSWGAPQQLTDDADMERSPAAAYTQDGTLVVAYTKVPMVAEQRTVEVAGRMVEVEVPTPDLADVSLCSLTRTIAGDLMVGDLRFSPENPVPGTTVSISATARNIGDLAAENVAVAFHNGDPAAGGELVGEVLIPGLLAAGASADVSLDWVVPGDSVERLTVFLTVDPENVLNDRDRSNNTANAGLLLPDLVLDVLYVETLGQDSYLATVRVANEGTLPVQDAPVVLREADGAGPLLAGTTVSLAPGASEELSFAVSPASREGGEFVVHAAVDPDDAIVEADEENNTRTASGATPVAPVPEITPEGGTYAAAQTVAIDCPLAGARITFTTDGSEPREDGDDYAIPFAVTSYTVVKARAFADGYDASPTAAAVFAFEGENLPPSILEVHAQALPGEPLSLMLTSSAADPDAGPQPLRYTWSDAAREGQVVFGPENGTDAGDQLGASFPEPGMRDLCLTVTDGEKTTVVALAVELPMDSDGDQVPDWWELTYLGGTLDGDGETDLDVDTLPDWWEWQEFGTLDQTATTDYDGDGEDNGTEYANGTDPTDARSTEDPANAYTDFYFAIRRAAVQRAEAGHGLAEMGWAGLLSCILPDGKEFVSGTLNKPEASAGTNPVALALRPTVPNRAESWTWHPDLDALMADFAPGVYRVHLVLNSTARGTTDLRFAITVPAYGADDFPPFVAIQYPAPSATDVSTAPVLEFDTDAWDLLVLLSSHGSEDHVHIREEGEEDTHTIPVGAGVAPLTSYTLIVDRADWGGTWLASGTYLYFTTGRGTQSITFDPLPAVSEGDPSFELVATATSGLPVSFASSDESVATVAGSTVTIVGAGTTTITASQAGDDDWNAAPDETQRLLVRAVDGRYVFVVTTTADAGPGTLRQAMLDAGTVTGAVWIRFAIPMADANAEDIDGEDAGGDPEADVFVIRPGSALPELNHEGGVTVDGASQALFAGDTNPAGPEIVLDGTQAGEGVDGFRLVGSDNQVLGLNIRGFRGSGIVLHGSQRNVVVGNLVGTDARGATAQGNGWDGIQLRNGASGNTIGGAAPNAGNVCSGNGRDGIALVAGATGNEILGNIVGADAAGASPVPNGGDGIRLDGAPANQIGQPGAGNVIGGNAGNGVNIVGEDALSFVWPTESGGNGHTYVALWQSNWVTWPQAHAAAQALGAHLAAVNSADEQQFINDTVLADGALSYPVLWIGLNDRQEEGVFAWTSGEPVSFTFWDEAAGQPDGGDWPQGVYMNVMYHWAGHEADRKGKWTGSGFWDEAAALLEFETAPDIVALQAFVAGGQTIRGNVIGLNGSGDAALPNGQHGIRLAASSANCIGGTEPGEANRIAGNVGAGIAIEGANARRNRIRGNAIYDNGGLPVDLGNDGTTPNDPLDADNGPNGLQNLPVLTAARPGNPARFSGVFSGAASQEIVLDFYAGPAGTREAEFPVYLGSAPVVTDALGEAAFEVELPRPVSPGQLVRATATDPSGNTSEYSEPATVAKYVPLIVWANPAEIVYGTELGDAQLNAEANTDGTFTYDPPAGTVLAAGAGQVLRVDFVPEDQSNWDGVAGTSVTIDVARAEQTIAFAALPVMASDAPPFVLTATATSGLPVSFASSDETVVRVQEDDGVWIATIVGVGEATVAASQGGDANWNPAPDVLRVLVANPVLTVVNGTGSGSYAPGSTATITGTVGAGRTFAGWTCEPPEFADKLASAGSALTYFLMPTADVTLTANCVLDEPEWSVDLTTAGFEPAKLSFGMHEAATGGFVEGLDVPGPVLPLLPGQAALVSDDLSLSYSTQFQAPAGTAEFLFMARAADAPIKVSWGAWNLPEGKHLTLYEVFLEEGGGRDPVARAPVGNTALDMGDADGIDIPAGEVRTYVIRYGDELVFDLAFGRGWNLVSLPIRPVDPAADAVLDDGQGTPIHKGKVQYWNGTAYADAVEIDALVGYWVYTETPGVILVEGHTGGGRGTGPLRRLESGWSEAFALGTDGRPHSRQRLDLASPARCGTREPSGCFPASATGSTSRRTRRFRSPSSGSLRQASPTPGGQEEGMGGGYTDTHGRTPSDTDGCHAPRSRRRTEHASAMAGGLPGGDPDGPGVEDRRGNGPRVALAGGQWALAE